MILSLPMLLIVALASARLWRLAAIDDQPIIVRLRAWLVGETTIDGLRTIRHYRRPTLHHLIACPWCLGSYIALGTFTLARLSPGVAVWILGPLAVGELIGLIVRNLDPSED